MITLETVTDIRQIAIEHRVFTLNEFRDEATPSTLMSKLTCTCGEKFRSTGKTTADSQRRVFKIHAMHTAQAITQAMAEWEAGEVTL